MTSIFTLVTLTLPRTMKLVCHPKLHQAPSSHQLTKTLQTPSHPPYEPLIRASKITKSKKPKPQLPCTGYNKIRQRSKASHRLKRRKTTSTSTSTNRITTTTLSPNPLLKPPQPPTPIGGLPKKSMRIVYWSGLFCTKTINSSGSQPPVQHNNTPGVRTHGNKGWFDPAGVALFSVAKLHMATKDGSKPDSSPFSSVARSYTWQRRMVQCRTVRPFHRSGSIHMTPRRGSMPNKLLYLSVARLYTWQRRMDQHRRSPFFLGPDPPTLHIFMGHHRRFHVFQQGVSGVIRGPFLASCSR